MRPFALALAAWLVGRSGRANTAAHHRRPGAQRSFRRPCPRGPEASRRLSSLCLQLPWTPRKIPPALLGFLLEWAQPVIPMESGGEGRRSSALGPVKFRDRRAVTQRGPSDDSGGCLLNDCCRLRTRPSTCTSLLRETPLPVSSLSHPQSICCKASC